MVTKEQLKTGLASYIENEFVSKMSGLKKWGFALISVPMINSIDAYIEQYHDAFMAAGFMTKDGMIDIDKIYERARKIANSTGDVIQNIPMIGDVKFSVSDVEMLYKYIRM